FADRGFLAITIDYYGQGDSSGDGASLTSCVASVAAAARWLRRQGAESVTCLGVSFGGALALHLADGLQFDQTIALEPFTSGRLYARQLKMLGQPFPDGSGAISVGGYELSSRFLTELADFSLSFPV